jgi:hypothetical protein
LACTTHERGGLPRAQGEAGACRPAVDHAGHLGAQPQRRPVRLAGIEATSAVVRTVGLVDLALAVGMFVGRPSWPWLLGRAASNPVIAAVSLASARSRRAHLLAVGLAVATAADLRTVARLRAAHR